MAGFARTTAAGQDLSDHLGPDRFLAVACDVTDAAQMDAAKHGGGFVMLTTASPINEPLAPATERNYFEWVDAGLKYGSY